MKRLFIRIQTAARQHRWALLILIIAAIPRLALLDTIPTAVNNDELDYMLTTRSVALAGSDLSGSWNPLSLTTPPSVHPQAELPSVLLSPFSAVLPFNLANARFPYALAGIAMSVSLYIIGAVLFGKKAGILAGIVGAFNPWSIFFSRTAFDVILSSSFVYIGMALLVGCSGYRRFLAFIPLCLAFYLYIGTKLIFLPLLLLCGIYVFTKDGKRTGYVFLLVAVVVGLLLPVLYAASIYRAPKSTRMNELLLPWSPDINEEVNLKRKLSVDSPITPLFVNKITVYMKEFANKYQGAFDPNLLYVNGDGQAALSIWEHGIFYLTDSVFLLVGLFWLIRIKRIDALFIIMLLIVTPIPGALSTVSKSYASRASLFFPVLMLLTGLGLSTVLNKLLLSGKFRYLRVVIGIVYAIQIANFIHLYGLRNPIYNSEGTNISSRILIKYLQFTNPERNVNVSNFDPSTPYKQILLYTNGLSRASMANVQKAFSHRKFEYGNISFSQCPVATTDAILADTTYITEFGTSCDQFFSSVHPHQITRLSDGGTIYNIYNDTTCVGMELQRYPSRIRFADLRIDSLPKSIFCQKYIMDITQ